VSHKTRDSLTPPQAIKTITKVKRVPPQTPSSNQPSATHKARDSLIPPQVMKTTTKVRERALKTPLRVFV